MGAAGKKIFRPPLMMVFVGLLFGGAGAGMLFMVLSTFQEKGIIVNGVERHDNGALAMSIAFLSIFIIFGLAVIVSTLLIRVEVTHTGLTIYNMAGQVAFGAPWSRVSSYFPTGGGSRATTIWQISADGTAANIPATISDYAGLQQAIVTQLPKEVFGGLVKTEPSTDRRPITPFDMSWKNGKDAYAMFFSILWYGFIGFFIFGLIQATNQSGKTDGLGLFIFALALFAIIPFSTFLTAWRRFFGGRLRVWGEGMTLNDGNKTSHVLWNDLIFIEGRTSVQRTKNSTSYIQELILVTKDSSILIDDRCPRFGEVEHDAFQAAPVGCIIVPRE